MNERIEQRPTRREVLPYNGIRANTQPLCPEFWTQALLRMQRCILAGMEFFPASSRPPWDVIRPILDVTDYMVLLLAGRYGSVTEDGIGYTEREYDYAFGQDIPVVAFTCDLAAGLRAARGDSDELQLERLRRFKSKVAGRHTVPGGRQSRM